MTSRRPSWGNDSSTGSWCDVEGVRVTAVCDGVPVVVLDEASPYFENASWMLQLALEAQGRAHSLYEYIDNDQIAGACQRLGFVFDEISVAQLKTREHSHIRAVGLSGKRSVMVSFVVALALENPDGLEELWDSLLKYKLNRSFAAITDHVTNVRKNGKKHLRNFDEDGSSRRRSSRRHDQDDRGMDMNHDAKMISSEGVEFCIICGNVPVVSLDKSSPFHGNTSWLLQSATGATGKADALMKYIEDRDILDACRKLGWTDQDVMPVSARSLNHVRAVGINGKRSAMLSLVAALILHEEVKVETLVDQVCEYDKGLEKHMRRFVQALMGSSAAPTKSRGSKSPMQWGKRRDRSLEPPGRKRAK